MIRSRQQQAQQGCQQVASLLQLKPILIDDEHGRLGGRVEMLPGFLDALLEYIVACAPWDRSAAGDGDGGVGEVIDRG
ncbi:hypothetical protein ADK54_17885 [Streptomyces sp. WM6378]|nr:hypothetical protein ADK54_17885 [Streptomyces sp. WM6378]